jgi:hypothetical protein
MLQKYRSQNHQMAMIPHPMHDNEKLAHIMGLWILIATGQKMFL